MWRVTLGLTRKRYAMAGIGGKLPHSQPRQGGGESLNSQFHHRMNFPDCVVGQSLSAV